MLTQVITPALRSHCEVLVNFYTDLSLRSLESLQRLSEVNLRLARELIAETGESCQRLLGSKSARSHDAGQHPGAALQNYRQGLSDAVNQAGNALAQTAETHLPALSRSANAMAEEMVRKTGEETARASERQKQLLERMGGAHHSGNGYGGQLPH